MVAVVDPGSCVGQDELSVAVTTAKKHISNLIGKLGVRNRTEAVARARDLRLL